MRAAEFCGPGQVNDISAACGEVLFQRTECLQWIQGFVCGVLERCVPAARLHGAHAGLDRLLRALGQLLR